MELPHEPESFRLKLKPDDRERDPKLCERKRARAATRVSAAGRTLAARPSSMEKLMKQAPLLKQLSCGRFGLPVGLHSLAMTEAAGARAIPQGIGNERLFEKISTAWTFGAAVKQASPAA